MRQRIRTMIPKWRDLYIEETAQFQVLAKAMAATVKGVLLLPSVSWTAATLIKNQQEPDSRSEKSSKA